MTWLLGRGVVVCWIFMYLAVQSPPPAPAESPQVTPKPHHVEAPRTASPALTKLAGRASWFDVGKGLYAAAGPRLRVGHWRGRTVSVCSGARCVKVRLTDWCQCYKGTNHEVLLDLSPDAFRKLSPLSRGIVRVKVTW